MSEAITTEKTEKTEIIILPDFELVRIDETEYYNALPLKAHGIKKVWGVYLYDKNCETRCCSFQKDFCLHYIGFAHEISSDMSDGECEAAYDYLLQANENSEDVQYRAVAEVERMDEKNKRSYNLFDDNMRLEASENRNDYDDLFESTMERYRGNPIW